VRGRGVRVGLKGKEAGLTRLRLFFNKDNVKEYVFGPDATTCSVLSWFCVNAYYML
jgi:hypothetical protein